MPFGNVGLRELADAIQSRIEEECPYLRGAGAIVEDTDDVETLRKGMGVGRWAVRVSFAPETITPEPGFTRVILWKFALNVTLLFRRMGGVSTRLDDMSGMDIGAMYKDTVIALQGQRLELLNQSGLECGPGRALGDPGDSVQAIRMTVTGRSRERHT